MQRGGEPGVLGVLRPLRPGVLSPKAFPQHCGGGAPPWRGGCTTELRDGGPGDGGAPPPPPGPGAPVETSAHDGVGDVTERAERRRAGEAETDVAEAVGDTDGDARAAVGRAPSSTSFATTVPGASPGQPRVASVLQPAAARKPSSPSARVTESALPLLKLERVER